jgi:hypothetical protein
VNRGTLLHIISRGSPYKNLNDTLKSLYGPTTVDLYINNTYTATGKITKGTQQGGPASPLLFNYYINPAALLLPMISQIEALSHPLVLIVFFADDILFIGLEHLRETFLNWRNSPPDLISRSHRRNAYILETKRHHLSRGPK